MTTHRYLNTALVITIVAILSASCLLDGPSEIDAIKATAEAKHDAIKSAAAKASNATARASKDYKTTVAAVQP